MIRKTLHSSGYAFNRRLFVAPACILLLGAIVSLALCVWIRAEHEKDIATSTAERAEAARSAIETHLKYRIASLRRMSGRWNAPGGISRTVWEDDARAYFRDQPEFQALVYLDPDAIVRWVVPFEPNERFVGLSLAFEPKRAAAIERARTSGKVSNSGIVDLTRGNKAQMFVFPLNVDGRLEGFLVGAYDILLLMETIVPSIPLQQFELRVIEDGADIFVLHDSEELLSDASLTVPFKVSGLDWTLQVTPHASFSDANALIEFFVVTVGLLASSLLAAITYFVQLNIYRTQREAEIAIRNQMTFEASKVGVWEWFDTSQKDQYWSPELYKLLGYEPNEIDANFDTFQAMIHPDDFEANKETIRTSLDTENIFRIESRMRKKNGIYEWFEFRGASRFNKNGTENVFATCASIQEQKTTEQSIADAHAFQDLIFTNIPALLFVKDEQFRIVNANPAFLSVYPEDMRDSLIGTTTLESYSPEEAEDFLRDDKLAFAEGRREVEETIDFPDGRRRTLATKKVRFENANGDRFILGVAHDITEMKRVSLELAQSEQQFRSAMENSAAGMGLLSPDGRWLNANSAMCNIMGYSAQELRETSFQALTHPDDIDANIEDIGKILAGERDSHQTEKRYIHKDGHTIWGLVTVALVRHSDGSPRHFIAQVLDITATKEFEQALVNSNKDLDNFAYIASHDLKEPLRGIHNYSRFLIEDYEDKLGEDGQHQLGRIMHLTQRMEALINDLLQFSRLGRETERRKPVDINAVIEEIDDMLPDQEKYRLLIPARLPTVVCDEIQIKEVFRNLITNGIRYNQSPEKTIEVGVEEAGGSSLGPGTVFYVKDNGIGIDQGFHGDIFKMFKRLHHRDAYGGGSGAGLAFVKKIIDRLGGEIWLESEPGKGSTFYFKLPDNGTVQ